MYINNFELGGISLLLKATNAMDMAWDTHPEKVFPEKGKSRYPPNHSKEIKDLPVVWFLPVTAPFSGITLFVDGLLPRQRPPKTKA